MLASEKSVVLGKAPVSEVVDHSGVSQVLAVGLLDKGVVSIK